MSKSRWTMMVVALGAIILSYEWYAQEKGGQRLKLHELAKDIERDPVPVIDKVKGLAPPKLGEHDHHH